MIAQFVLSSLLAAVLLYAWTEYRRAPLVAVLTVFVATAGIYFVWVPEHSTQLAELVGIGRGVDLILYIWVCISLIVLLNLHLKLRTQMELITTLARKAAIADAPPARTSGGSQPLTSPLVQTSRVNPSKGPIEALNLVDQDQRLVSAQRQRSEASDDN